MRKSNAGYLLFPWQPAKTQHMWKCCTCRQNPVLKSLIRYFWLNSLRSSAYPSASINFGIDHLWKHFNFRKEWGFEDPLSFASVYSKDNHVLLYIFFLWHFCSLFFLFVRLKEILYIFVGQQQWAASQFLTQYQQWIYSSKKRKLWRDSGLWEGGFVWFCCLNLQSCFWQDCHQAHKGKVESSTLKDL